MGITVLPPDVNASTAMFTPVGNDIRFGLAASAMPDDVDATSRAHGQGRTASIAGFPGKVWTRGNKGE